MYHSDEIIRQMQTNKILAQKLDMAVAGVRDLVRDQVKKIGAGATRLVYYTSCFTKEYQDVCAKQKNEDTRFRYGVFCLIKDRDIIFELIRVYIEILLKHRTAEQLESIKHLLMKANVHIAASSLTNQAFALGITTTICLTININAHLRNLMGKISGIVAGGLGVYGMVQEAADSAIRLQTAHPIYYQALYFHELEMMYFLVEPLFIHAGALSMQPLSDVEVAKNIINLIK